MSGTSLDGIDVALLDSNGLEGLVCRQSEHFEYDSDFTKIGLQISQKLSDLNPPINVKDIRKQYHDFSHRLTMLHASSVKRFLEKYNFLAHNIDYLAFHGQTILHRPKNAITIQLGNPKLLANITDIPVIHSFRENDMKKKGQGAPLVPIFHQLIAKKYMHKYDNGAIVNIGGVANITFIYNIKADITDQIAACDCGPGNAPIDDMMRRYFNKQYDQYGNIANSAKVNEEIVSKALKNPFFEKKGPKSLDRNQFSSINFNQLPKNDAIASLSAFVADAISLCIRQRQKNAQFIAVSGGGRLNRFILKRIKKNMLDKEVCNIDEFGVNGDFIEAQALAYLAARTILKLPITMPLTTGTEKPATGGFITKPQNTAE